MQIWADAEVGKFDIFEAIVTNLLREFPMALRELEFHYPRATKIEDIALMSQKILI